MQVGLLAVCGSGQENSWRPAWEKLSTMTTCSDSGTDVLERKVDKHEPEKGQHCFPSVTDPHKLDALPCPLFR